MDGLEQYAGKLGEKIKSRTPEQRIESLKQQERSLSLIHANITRALNVARAELGLLDDQTQGERLADIAYLATSKQLMKVGEKYLILER